MSKLIIEFRNDEERRRFLTWYEDEGYDDADPHYDAHYDSHPPRLIKVQGKSSGCCSPPCSITVKAIGGERRSIQSSMKHNE